MTDGSAVGSKVGVETDWVRVVASQHQQLTSSTSTSSQYLSLFISGFPLSDYTIAEAQERGGSQILVSVWRDGSLGRGMK